MSATRFLEWDDVELAAQALAGNHETFDSFVWWERPEDSDRWCVVYSHHRDSGLLDQSNAAAIEKALEAFMDGEAADVIPQRHNHWAVGWVDGYAIRVYGPGGQITEAFRTYCELQVRYHQYPILDESDYSQREYEATLENVREVGRRFVADDAPEGWEGEAFSWFWECNQRAVENRDDQGGYPTDDEMKECLRALGWLHPDYAEEEEPLTDHKSVSNHERG
jgi:hypothetical protein